MTDFPEDLKGRYRLVIHSSTGVYTLLDTLERGGKTGEAVWDVLYSYEGIGRSAIPSLEIGIFEEKIC